MKTLLINMLVIAVLLLILEIAIRLSYPGLHPVGEDENLFLKYEHGGFGYKPFSSGYAHGAWFEIDEYGHRAFTKLAAKTKALLVIGDSVTVGVGVDADQIYPSLLDKQLTEYSIINAAVTGYAFSDYVSLLKRELAQQHIDGVIVGICLNDYSTLNQAAIVDTLTKKNIKTRTEYKLKYANFMLRSLRYINDHYFDFNKYLKQYWLTSLWIKSLLSDTQRDNFLYDLKFYQQPDAKELLMADLIKLKTLAEEQGVWIKFFIFPYEYQLREAAIADFLPQQLIMQAAKESGVYILDLSAGLLATDSSSKLFLYLDPMHFSVAGHEITADLILQDIEQK